MSNEHGDLKQLDQLRNELAVMLAKFDQHGDREDDRISFAIVGFTSEKNHTATQVWPSPSTPSLQSIDVMLRRIVSIQRLVKANMMFLSQWSGLSPDGIQELLDNYHRAVDTAVANPATDVADCMMVKSREETLKGAMKGADHGEG